MSAMRGWLPSKGLDIRTLLATHTTEFLEELPVIRDGDPDGVHNARVASRRLRELLPLVSDGARPSKTESLIATTGKQLGEVRDLDVMIDVLDRKAATVPAAALAIASARRTVASRLNYERRALIKALEGLELDQVAARHRRHRPLAISIDVLRWRTPWQPALRERIGHRAEQLREAVAHATGVYFPNRLHSVRVAVKKLRYAVEAASHLGAWNPPHMLKDLRKIQTGLGDLHDAQILRDRAGNLIDANVPAHETTALIAALDADISARHEEYLRRRDRLQLIADVCDRFARHARLPRRVAAAPALTAAALPASFDHR